MRSRAIDIGVFPTCSVVSFACYLLSSQPGQSLFRSMEAGSEAQPGCQSKHEEECVFIKKGDLHPGKTRAPPGPQKQGKYRTTPVFHAPSSSTLLPPPMASGTTRTLIRVPRYHPPGQPSRPRAVPFLSFSGSSITAIQFRGPPFVPRAMKSTPKKKTTTPS